MANIFNPGNLVRAERGEAALDDLTITLNPADNVAIARNALLARTVLTSGNGNITVMRMIPPGHKIAIQAIPGGAEIIRYGQVIGHASEDIAAGDHVHSHNVATHQGELKLDYAFSTNVQPVE